MKSDLPCHIVRICVNTDVVLRYGGVGPVCEVVFSEVIDVAILVMLIRYTTIEGGIGWPALVTEGHPEKRVLFQEVVSIVIRHRDVHCGPECLARGYEQRV